MNRIDAPSTAPWKHLYEAAVLELDSRRLLGRIEEARRAILQCLASTDPADRDETEPLTNALQVLQDLNKIDGEHKNGDAA